MTDRPKPDATDPSPASQGASRWWPVVVPSIALLVGLLIGIVVMSVANTDDNASSSDQQPQTSPSSGGPTGSPTGNPTTIVIPAACLAAVDTVDQLTDLSKQGADAIRNFAPQQLRDLLTRLQKLDQQARRQAQACRDAKVETSPSPSPSQ